MDIPGVDRSALHLGTLWAQQRKPQQPPPKTFRGHGAGAGRSCLPLALLLIVSLWAVLAFGVTVARAVS